MLSGEIVSLRAIEPRDLEQLLNWRNKPEFRRYFREYRELSLEQQHAWYKEKVINDPATCMFAIECKKTGRLLGACGLCYIDRINRSSDFSIYIGHEDLYIDGKYAIDAARLLICYGFAELNLHRLWSEIYEFDSAKVHMFKTLGFQLDGRHRQTHWTENRWYDSLFFGLINEYPGNCN
jgi:RimJ/RimL family protein N-acetyltransferase